MSLRPAFRFAAFAVVSALAAVAASPAQADKLYLVSQSNGTIGTYDSVTGAGINPSLVTGLTTPHAIAFDPALNFYVTGFTGEYVAKYANNGTLINPAYLNPASFNQPAGVAVNGAGEIFVVNNALMNGQTSVSKFAADGTIINTNFVNAFGSPDGAMISGGDLYVVRWAGSAVGKYTSSGTSGTTINDSFLSPGAAINTWRPFNVVRDSLGNFYVSGNAPFGTSSGKQSMVSKFGPDGTLINAELIAFSSGNQAYGLAIDSDDNLYLGSYAGSTIGKYRPDGTAVNTSFITGLSGVTSIAIQPVPEPENCSLAIGALAAGAGWLARRRRIYAGRCE